MKKKHLRVLLPAAAAIAAVAAALNTRLTVRHYAVESDKLTGPVRLVLLTDLHACAYGAGQRELLDAVERQHPDLVLLGGDILDDDPALPEENAWTVIETLGRSYPTFYVTGNHEFWSGRVEAIKARIADSGVTVLEGEGKTVLFRGQPLSISGVDDPAAGAEIWQAQLARAAQGAGEGFSLLLTHRPERTSAYEGRGFDLILAGHAHGGQWRIPLLLNGLLAPNQGFFPAFAGGRYELGETTLIVSRGLARESTRVPRIFNPPELVVVELLPLQAQQKNN
ncbi:metallophosphoesterase [uncultured Intestinimonas sp.]|uniref:metallophosphoesterase n=1 Tax=uncultured Intestinimonas sp. TaxID=1689265 RepID=UPI0029422931|nr:metallophosphoesterase [uncultured Intestinimonas sp.]